VGDCGRMWPRATLSCTTGNSLRASQNPVTGRVRPAGRMLPVPEITHLSTFLDLTIKLIIARVDIAATFG